MGSTSSAPLPAAPFFRMQLPCRLAALAAVVLVSGCSQVPVLPGLMPYRMEIQQGNYVTQEMVSKLKPGMTREQVRFILGTPLVTDIFHADRWDYVYRRIPQRGGGEPEQRRLAVFFEGDRLVRLEGDVVARPERTASSGTAGGTRQEAAQGGAP